MSELKLQSSCSSFLPYLDFPSLMHSNVYEIKIKIFENKFQNYL